MPGETSCVHRVVDRRASHSFPLPYEFCSELGKHRIDTVTTGLWKWHKTSNIHSEIDVGCEFFSTNVFTYTCVPLPLVTPTKISDGWWDPVGTGEVSNNLKRYLLPLIFQHYTLWFWSETRGRRLQLVSFRRNYIHKTNVYYISECIVSIFLNFVVVCMSRIR